MTKAGKNDRGVKFAYVCLHLLKMIPFDALLLLIKLDYIACDSLGLEDPVINETEVLNYSAIHFAGELLTAVIMLCRGLVFLL